MRYVNYLKKIFVLLFAALSISIVHMSNSGAASLSETYLLKIMEYTQGTMMAVENLPQYLRDFAELSTSLMAQDTGETSIISIAQAKFAELGQGSSQSREALNDPAYQQQVMADLLGESVSAFKGKDPSILSRLPNVNNLAYSTLVGAAPLPNASKNPYEYVKNVAGFNFVRPPLNASWQGSDEAKAYYAKFFDTATAITSFNAYVMSSLKTDAEKNPNQAKLQEELMSTVSSSDWLAQVATEEIGKVLRQILLFEAQNYVLNLKMQQNQREVLVAHAMTNSLLILMNQINEIQLLRRAKGLPKSED
jgi:hypothetical protein